MNTNIININVATTFAAGKVWSLILEAKAYEKRAVRALIKLRRRSAELDRGTFYRIAHLLEVKQTYIVVSWFISDK